MKSVVLEIKNDKAALLDDNGIVHTVKNKDYKVGQVLYLTEFELRRDEVNPSKRHSTFIRTAVAIFAVAVVGGGVTSYAAPVSTVTLDGASSVEYRLNMYDRVVGAGVPDGADEDFRKEISDFSKEIRGMEINDAIDATTERFGDEMFRPDADGNKPNISIKVDGLKKNNRHLSDKMDHKREEVKKMMPENKTDPVMEKPAINDEEKSGTEPEEILPAEDERPADHGIPTEKNNGEHPRDIMDHQENAEKPEDNIDHRGDAEKPEDNIDHRDDAEKPEEKMAPKDETGIYKENITPKDGAGTPKDNSAPKDAAGAPEENTAPKDSAEKPEENIIPQEVHDPGNDIGKPADAPAPPDNAQRDDT
ncbi:MAG: hypothetical protein K6E34_01260 [Lachnospiraceae bacterium]|nr:hypothetical protein [Lachnospiraceae bacterium]